MQEHLISFWWGSWTQVSSLLYNTRLPLQNERHIVNLLNLRQSEGKQQQQYEGDGNVFGILYQKFNILDALSINFHRVSAKHQCCKHSVHPLYDQNTVHTSSATAC